MGFPKIKMDLEDSPEVLALLDIDAKINIIRKKVIQNAELAIRQGFYLKLVSYTGYNQPFLGLLKKDNNDVCVL